MDRQRLKAYALEEHDIVFSRVGSIDRNALIRSAEVGWLFSGRLLRLRLNPEKAFAPYLSYQFHTEAFKLRVKSVAVGQTMPSLNTQILNGIDVALPPLPEQSALAAVLSDMDAEIAALEERRAKTRALKQGMMQELLTGRIRLVSAPSANPNAPLRTASSPCSATSWATATSATGPTATATTTSRRACSPHG